MIWSLLAMLAYTLPETVQPGERLIIVGRDRSEFDGCSAQARVTSGASVRIAPLATAAEKGKLPKGQMLSLCGEDGDYVSVVYKLAEDGEVDCGVSTPSPYVGAYRGPCRYGWVSSRAIELVAG